MESFGQNMLYHPTNEGQHPRHFFSCRFLSVMTPILMAQLVAHHNLQQACMEIGDPTTYFVR